MQIFNLTFNTGHTKRPVAYTSEVFNARYFLKHSATAFQLTSKTSIINILSYKIYAIDRDLKY